MYVIDDVAPNALVVAQVRGTDAIAVTTGLVNCVDRVQLEGVVAHLVSRLRSGDVATLTRMSVLFGAPVIVGEMLQRKKWRNGGRVPRAGDPADSHGALSSLAAAIGSASGEWELGSCGPRHSRQLVLAAGRNAARHGGSGSPATQTPDPCRDMG